jgi:hypothetical protein
MMHRMLFEPELHEPLTEDAWDEARARDAIRGLVADADRAFDPDGLWPAAEWDSWQTTPPLKNLYVGAAGVFLALDLLRRRGYAETTIDLVGATRRTLERWREHPDFERWTDLPSSPHAALLCGESGLLLTAWRVEPSPDLAGELHTRVHENLGNEAVEVMWGAPGTMLAARAMHEWTGDERWAEAWRESADSVLEMRDEDGLWTNRLYGETFRSLTPPHGLVGNVQALRPGLDDDHCASLEREAADLLARFAVHEDGLANWPRRAGVEPDRLQWCSGAPGIIVGAASYLDEGLLLAGAELIWHAGPPGMEKGSGVCHGTAGNGHSFLKVFERTGDELWLDRARRFAVHALGQIERRGTGRYSLFTGDVGVALFVADCIEGRSAFPVTESL